MRYFRHSCALVAFLGCSQINLFAQDTGSISGLVSSDSTGSPIGGVTVYCHEYNSDGGYWSLRTGAQSDESGLYTFQNLPPGSYRLEFRDLSNSHLSEFHINASSLESAADIAVQAAQETVVDASLADAATISGRVTAQTGGAGLQGVNVSVYRFAGGHWQQLWWLNQTVTDASGNYTVRGLPAGNYRLEFRDSSGEYAPEFYDNAASVDVAISVSVAVGQDLLNVDVALADAATISGRVTAQTGGAGLQGVNVSVYRFAGGYWQHQIEWATTDASGNYTVRGLPAGSHHVVFSDSTGDYVTEFYNNARTFESATAVNVPAGQDVGSIDAALADAATISGRVTAQSGSAGLQGVSVSVHDFGVGQWQRQIGWATTDASGNYTVRGLPAGNYRLEFRDNSGEYALEFYNNARTFESATAVNVPAGQDVGSIDAALADAATISGRVTAQTGGAGLQGVNVSVYRFAGGYWQEQIGWATTDASGNYTVSGLPAGSYRLEFADPAGDYAKEFYNGALTVESAQSVAVAEGADVANISVALADGATISGRVTAQSGGGSLEVVNVSVYRYDAFYGSWPGGWTGNTVTADVMGNYTVRGLPAGSYRLEFIDPAGDYAKEYYNDALTVESAQSVAVAEGADIANINASLADGATISGRVTAQSGGAALRGMNVSVYRFVGGQWQPQSLSATTDASGDYTVRGLPAGSYRLKFIDPAGEYAKEYYTNAPMVESASTVSVAANQDVGGFDVALADAATISGQVTAHDGAGPLEGVLVEAYRVDTRQGYWNFISTGTVVISDAMGNYTVGGLPAGTYRLFFRDPSGAYAQEYYTDALTVETGQSVVVTEGQSVASINVALSNGASISGKVTAHSGGGALEGVQVETYRYDARRGDWTYVWTVTSVATDFLGNYVSKGLPAGTYRLFFRDPSGAYAQEYYSDALTVETGQSVVVTEGQSVASINVALSNGASISGKVSAQSGGASLEGVNVSVYRYDTRQGYWDGIWTGKMVATDAMGDYTVRGLPAGAYRLEFRDPSGSYSQEYYSDALTVEAAQSVAVSTGQAVSNIDVSLAAGASISGRVTAQPNGPGLEAIRVTVYGYDPRFPYSNYFWLDREVFTDASGNYTVGGLPAGTYRVEFLDPSGQYALEYHSGASSYETASGVVVGEGSHIANVDAVLGSGATLTGRVTAQTGGSALEGIEVQAYRFDTAIRQWTIFASRAVRTDGVGNFSITGLPDGEYRVEFKDPAGDYALQYFGNTPTVETATSVALSAGATRTGIDATLANAGSISGVVTTAASPGVPLEDVRIEVYRLDPLRQEWEHFWHIGDFSSDIAGNYTVSGLAAGTYALEFSDPAGVFARRFYSNNPTSEPASSIEVLPGADVVGINVALGAGATISGVVLSDEGSSPVRNINVTAYLWIQGYWLGISQEVLTADDGSFAITGLAAGTYRVGFFDWLSFNRADQYYSNAYSFESATSLSIAAGQTLSLGEIPMRTASSLEGRVTGPDGVSPLLGITVTPYRRNETTQSWEKLEPLWTIGDGTFTFPYLTQGSYTLEFTDPSGVHLGEFYNNAPNKTAAHIVDLLAGQSVGPLQVSLALAGYDAWKSGYGSVGSQTEDDDRDGLSNGAEYAFGTNPTVPDSGRAIKMQANGANLTLEFLRRNQGATSVLQENSDLKSGTWVSSQIPVIESPDQSGVTIGYTRMRCVVPATGTKFFRVRATF